MYCDSGNEKKGNLCNVTKSDIPYVIEFARQELLPIGDRDEMYQLLRQNVPQFSVLTGDEN